VIIYLQNPKLKTKTFSLFYFACIISIRSNSSPFLSIATFGTKQYPIPPLLLSYYFAPLAKFKCKNSLPRTIPRTHHHTKSLSTLDSYQSPARTPGLPFSSYPITSFSYSIPPHLPLLKLSHRLFTPPKVYLLLIALSFPPRLPSFPRNRK